MTSIYYRAAAEQLNRVVHHRPDLDWARLVYSVLVQAVMVYSVWNSPVAGLVWDSTAPASLAVSMVNSVVSPHHLPGQIGPASEPAAWAVEVPDSLADWA